MRVARHRAELECRELRDPSVASFEARHAKTPWREATRCWAFQLGARLEPAGAHSKFAEPGPPPSLGYTDLFTEWTDRAAVIALSAGRNRRIAAPKSAIPVRQREVFAREIFRRTINWTLGNDICQPEFAAPSRKPVDDIAGKPLPAD
jgi:hypothetical protein